MTHTSSCLTFNQRGSSLSLSLALCPAVPRPHNDSSFNWIFAAAATTNKSNKNNNNKHKTTQRKRELQFSTGGCRSVSFYVTLPVFAGFSWLFSGYQLSSLFFFFVPALAFLCNWRSARALARLLFLRNKVYISHIHHFWQLQLIVCNVGQMDGPV